MSGFIDINEALPKVKGLMEILEFQHQNRKLRNPLNVQDILDHFKEEAPDSCCNIKADFCKKNSRTGLVKRFRCNACKCLIESVAALLEHSKGNKHKSNTANFDPHEEKSVKESFVISKKPEKVAGSKNRKRKPDLTLTLKEVFEAQQAKKEGQDLIILGLRFVQEFRNPVNPSLPLMYKCKLFKCDGSWGNSHKFWPHLASDKHLQSFFYEVEELEGEKMVFDEQSQKIDESDLLQKAAQFMKTSNHEINFEEMEVIDDEERYWIQADRCHTSKRVGSANII